MHLGAKLASFSEYALISLKVLPDFGSTMRRFAVRRSERVSLVLAERPANGRPLLTRDQSLGSSFRDSRSQKGDSLRLIFEKLPFLGDCGRRRGSICTAWPVKRPYPRFESLSLRQLAEGRVFSRRSRWQLSPTAVAIF
jgi:hypothetical protein